MKSEPPTADVICSRRLTLHKSMTPLTQIMPSPPHMSHPDVLMSTVASPAADNGDLKTAVAICIRHGGGLGACALRSV